MENILVQMLQLGMRVEFDCVLKKIEDTEPLQVRFQWSVTQDYVRYKESCEWEAFETEESCIADFKARASQILEAVRKLLNEKNKKF